MVRKIHEWLADHTRWVQYPAPEVIPAKKRPPFWRWNHQMPWELRVSIGSLSIAALIVLIPVLALMLLFAWFFIASLIGGA